MANQKSFFKQAYDFGSQRLSKGYGWPMEIDPQVKLFLDDIKLNIVSGRGLDIGCGQGRHTFLLAEYGFDAYGIDFLKRPIQEANERARQESNKNVHFSVMDVLDLDFPDNYFEVIVDWSVLDHIYPKDWTRYIKNLNRVLISGGYLLLAEFSSKDKRITDQNKNFNNGSNYDHFFREDEIKKLFEEDFEIKRIVHNELHTTSHFSMINVLLKRSKSK